VNVITSSVKFERIAKSDRLHLKTCAGSPNLCMDGITGHDVAISSIQTVVTRTDRSTWRSITSFYVRRRKDILQNPNAMNCNVPLRPVLYTLTTASTFSCTNGVAVIFLPSQYRAFTSTVVFVFNLFCYGMSLDLVDANSCYTFNVQ